jgi:hypothetical protein
VAWATPAIFTLNQWLADLWAESGDAYLLNLHQEAALWFSITTHRYHGQLAKTAWQLIQEWTAGEVLHTYPQTAETRAFQGWQAAFSARCLQEGWVTGAELPARLTDQVTSGKMRVGQSVWLLGFDLLNPNLQRLIDAINQANPQQVQEMTVASKQPNPTAVKIVLSSEAAEIEAMACWAAAMLEQNPQASIGCVVPRLQDNYRLIEYYFTRQLAPKTLLGAGSQKRPFQISAVQPLAHFPLIDAALQLLGLEEETPPAALGHSPFITIDRVVPHHFDTQAKTTPTHWVQLFMRYLKACAWAETRVFNSEEYQLVQAWHKLLQTFVSLSCIRPTLGYAAAMRQLRYLAEHVTFQPKRVRQPIQVLGPLEATGISFDRLWVMGCDEQAWPPRVGASPLLPLALQRERGMPGAHRQQQMDFYQHVMTRLLTSSTHIVVSYAEKKADILQSPTAFIAAIEPVDHWSRQSNLPEAIVEAVTQTPEMRMQSDTMAWETLLDDRAPVVDISTPQKGGSQILTYQAACPFRAFAEFRLNARQPKRVYLGLSPIERGIALHDALASIWQELQDHQTLCKQTDARLERLIDEAVNAALKSAKPQHLLAHIKIEINRLSSLVKVWLDLEKTRPPFKVIAIEAPIDTTLAGITFHLQIDRIDQTPHGERLLIDYKTGNTSVQSWLSDRPDAPQLPLYLIAHSPEATVIGIAFAQINSNEIKIKGLCNQDDILPKINLKEFELNWHDQCNHWRAVLTQLANDFQQGDASVNPKSPQKTCQTCHLQALCRIADEAIV